MPKPHDMTQDFGCWLLHCHFHNFYFEIIITVIKVQMIRRQLYLKVLQRYAHEKFLNARGRQQRDWAMRSFSQLLCFWQSMIKSFKNSHEKIVLHHNSQLHLYEPKHGMISDLTFKVFCRHHPILYNDHPHVISTSAGSDLTQCE